MRKKSEGKEGRLQHHLPMASPSSSSRPSPSPPLPPRSPIFTPILEHKKEKQEEVLATRDEDTTTVSRPYKHQPTPIHPSSSSSSSSSKSTAPKKPSSRSNGAEVAGSVSCTNCRPSTREKISVVSFNINGLKQHVSSLSPSPGRLLHSLFLSVARRSPHSSSSAAPSSSAAANDEWHLAAAELSRKLVHATRKRDEALLESSRLKHSLAELECKLGRLESHCHDLQAALDRRSSPNPVQTTCSFPVETFLRAVSDARVAVRHLSRSLAAQLRPDRMAALLQPHDARAAGQWRRTPGSLLFCMEALLNRVFYLGLEEGELDEAVDPVARCEANRAAYEAVRGLGWDEVLSKGTRFYSEGLSRFCDRKMSEVVGMLGWAKAWPEALLKAFFGAAKGAWVVRLLSRSVHPAVPVLRADRGARFDPRFMEDAAADRVIRLEPVSVRMIVAPGFHVYTSDFGVVKCKVLCSYSNGCNGR